jgi:hypothetical protein
MLGNGLYVSTDPVATREYGGDSWALVRYTLPKGFRFLDIRASDRQVPLSTRSLDRLRAKGCQAPSFNRLLASDAGPLCRKIVADTLKVVQADAVLYWYAVVDFDQCPKRPGSAFLIVDGTRFMPEGAVVFTEESSGVDRLMIQTMFRDTRHPNAGLLPWPKLEGRKPEREYAAYVESSVFGCGAAEEDRYPDPETAASYDYGQIFKRFEVISKQVGKLIDPIRIRDFDARRFINRPDWERFVAAGGVDPRLVYEPKPITWDNWQRVDEEEVRRAVHYDRALTLDMLKSWNKDAILGTVPEYTPGGEIKKNPNFGKAVTRDTALDAEGVDAVQFFKFQGEDQYALKWVDLKCQEDVPDSIPLPGENPECRKISEQIAHSGDRDAFWADTRADFQAGRFKDRWYWYACWPRAEVTHGTGKYCGMIAYPEPDTVERRLKRIIKRVDDYFAGGDRLETPLAFALDTQRELVALHPFNKGNGRVSRWVMDYISLRSALPPVMIRNMDFDISTPGEKYLQQGLEGVGESVNRLRACLHRYETEDFQAIQATSCGLLGDPPIDPFGGVK